MLPRSMPVAERMNAELARDNDQQFFVTAVVARLVLASGELTYCNAGHPPVLCVRGCSCSPTASPKPVNETGALFSDDRLVEIVGRCAPLAPPQVVDAIVKGVTTFAGRAPQEDDITVLALRYTGGDRWRRRPLLLRLPLAKPLTAFARRPAALSSKKAHCGRHLSCYSAPATQGASACIVRQ